MNDDDTSGIDYTLSYIVVPVYYLNFVEINIVSFNRRKISFICWFF